MKKRLSVLTLSLYLVLSAFSVTALADAPVSSPVAQLGESSYPTLAVAVAAVHAETEETRMGEHLITLTQDASGGGFAAGYELLNYDDETQKNTTSGNAPVNLTVDLGEHTYTLTAPTVGSAGTETNNFQFLKGSKVTIKNGTIRLAADAAANIVFQNYCDLTLEDVTVEGGNSSYILSCNYGTSTLTNVDITAKTGGTAIDLMHWLGTSYGGTAPSLSIRNTLDNTIDGSIAVYCYENDSEKDDCDAKPTLTIHGGRYSDLPTAVQYAASGSTLGLSGDCNGRITVDSGKTLTLDLGGHKLSTSDSANEAVITNLGILTLTGTGTISNTTHYVLDNHGTMTIQSGVTVCKNEGSTNTASLIRNGGGSNSAEAPARLTIQGGNFLGKSGSKSCAVVKNDTGGILTINGGTFDSTANTDEHNATTILNWHQATITGGSFTGSYPITNGYHDESELGQFTITGGSFTGTLALLGQADSDGKDYALSGGTLSLTGGTFTSPAMTKADAILKYTLSITGGTFQNTDPTAYVPSGYVSTKNNETTWTVGRAPSSTSSAPTKYTATLSGSTNGAVSLSPRRAAKGSTVTLTVTPEEGYALASLQVLDSNGNEIPLTQTGEGKYTFVMPKGGVSVNASFLPEEPQSPEGPAETLPFTDVKENAYYYDALRWAVEQGIATGTSETTFSPEAPCTRGEIITFLWRAAGCPVTGQPGSCPDVSPEAYYAQAVAWALEKGITTGTAQGNFSPDAVCTRAQVVTFLCRMAGATAYPTTGFSDVDPQLYYADAVSWAVEQNITLGIGDGQFGPELTCTRGQIITFLYRLLAK